MPTWDDETIGDAISRLAARVNAIDPGELGPFPFRKLFDEISEVRAAFKEGRFASRDRRQNLWDTLQSLGNRLAEIRATYRENCIADQPKVSSAINNLNFAHHASIGGHAPWQDFWSKERETRELLKACRFLDRDARSAAWDAFNDVVNEAKIQREQRQREREHFDAESNMHKERVVWHVEHARPVVGLIADLLTIDWVNTRHDELKLWSAELRTARTELAERGDKMTGKDRRDVRELIAEVREDLNAAWNQWKEWAGEIRERRASEWRERMTSRRNKLEEIIRRKEDFITKQEENLAKLQEMLGNARSDERVSQIEGWINEATERRDSAELERRELESQLAEVNEKLG